MSYLVTGALATFHDNEGHIHYRYRGEALPEGVDSADVKHLLLVGLIEKSKDDFTTMIVSGDGTATLERPSARASKATWVDYWVAQGMDRAEAEKLNRDDLAELTEVPAAQTPAPSVTE